MYASTFLFSSIIFLCTAKKLIQSQTGLVTLKFDKMKKNIRMIIHQGVSKVFSQPDEHERTTQQMF